MSAEIITLGVTTTLDLPPDRVLEAAKGKMKTVIVIGVTEDGEEYFAASNTDRYQMLWMAERFRETLMAGAK